MEGSEPLPAGSSSKPAVNQKADSDSLTDIKTSSTTKDQHQPAKMSKFPSMNISKFIIKDDQKNAEEIINEFIGSIREKFKAKKTKRRLNFGEENKEKTKEKHEISSDGTGTIDQRNEASGNKMETSDGQEGVQQSEQEKKENIQEKQPFRKNNETPDSKGTSYVADRDTADTDIKELQLKEETKHLIQNHHSGFEVKLYVLTTERLTSKTTTAVQSVINAKQISECATISRSYMFFFFKGDASPEIYVMTSGQAYRYFQDRSCSKFPKKIARRLLKFQTIEFQARHVTGDTKQTKVQHLPSWQGRLNVWDLMDVIVHSYRAYPTDRSSIYNLECFKAKQGKKRTVSISGKQVFIEVHQEVTLKDMMDIISHFALIDRGDSTELLDGGKEGDDKHFEQFEYIQEVKSESVIKVVEKSDISTFAENIPLSMPDVGLMHKADSFQLFYEGEHMDRWTGCPPMLDDVLKALKGKCENEINFEWLRKYVKLKIISTDNRDLACGPVTDFLVGHISNSLKSHPCILWHGKWLEIKAEYFKILADSFGLITKENSIDSGLILPLPWVTRKRKYSKQEMHTFLGSVMSEFSEKTKGYEFYSETLALMYDQLHMTLYEAHYNSTYGLLDLIIPMTSPTQQVGYIVGDKVLCQNIEMFDILHYNETHTYLIHVKDGLGQHVRDVCSQVKNSADLLVSELTYHSSSSVVDEMWIQFASRLRAGGSLKPGCSRNDEKVTYEGEKKQPKSSSDEREQPQINRIQNGEEMMMHLQKPNEKSRRCLNEKEFKGLFTGNRKIVYVLAIRDTRVSETDLTSNRKDKQLKAELAEVKGRTVTPKEWQMLKEKKYVNDDNTITKAFRRECLKVFKEEMLTEFSKQTEKEDNRNKSQKTEKQDRGVFSRVTWKHVYHYLKSQTILDLLKEKGYVGADSNITDKFREVKSQAGFVGTMIKFVTEKMKNQNQTASDTQHTASNESGTSGLQTNVDLDQEDYSTLKEKQRWIEAYTAIKKHQRGEKSKSLLKEKAEGNDRPNESKYWQLLENKGYVDTKHNVRDYFRKKSLKDFVDEMVKFSKETEPKPQKPKKEVGPKKSRDKTNWVDVYHYLKSQTALRLLQEKVYVDNDYNVTDKYRMEIKNETEFVTEMINYVKSKLVKQDSDNKSVADGVTGKDGRDDKSQTLIKKETNLEEANQNGKEDEGKSAVETIQEDYTSLEVKERWKEIYDVLKLYLPGTNSTIAQMEIVSLFSYFQKYQDGPNRLKLKICFI